MRVTRTKIGIPLLLTLAASVTLAAGATLAGCATDSNGESRMDAPADGTATGRGATTTDLPRRQGYSLLYQLVTDESKVDGILFIKDASPGTKEAIKSIAARAKRAKEDLDALAESDPTLKLDEPDLPAVEEETREAISSKTAKLLLTSSGEVFEMNLLLTQYEALKYLAALSQALAEREPAGPRKAMLEKLSADTNTLHEGVMILLERRRAPQT